MTSLNISSCWVHDPVLVRKSVLIREGKDFDFDPDSVSVDSCFQLCKPVPHDEGSPVPACNLVLQQVGRLKRISKVVLVGGFRRLEAHRTASGEYLTTFKGRLLQDSEPDLEVFKIAADLSYYDLTSLELRVPCSSSTEGPSDFWIMALLVGMEEQQPPPAPGSHRQQTTAFGGGRFNLTRLESMLGDSDLSEKARDFKKLFTDFQQSGGGKVLTAVGAAPESDVMGLKTLCTLSSGGEGGTRDLDAPRSDMVTKQDLLDVEKRLSEKIEKGLAEQSRKLDQISLLLEQISSKL